MPRDPRIDPRPGDVLEVGPQWQAEHWKVLSVTGGMVKYRPYKNAGRCCSISQWRGWTANATVLEVGKDA